MRILFRYLLGELARVFTLCFTGLISLYLIVDFFEKLRKFLKHDAEWIWMLAYFAYRIPHVSFQLIPVAVLMATLLSLGVLLRNNEITAMRSCGISLVRMTLPFTCFAVAAALVMLALSSVIVPVTNLRAEQVKEVRIMKKAPGHAFRAERTWVEIGDQTLMNVEAVDSGGTILRGVRLYRLGSNFQLAEVTQAEEARYTHDGWELRTGTAQRLSPNGLVRATTFEARPLRLDQIPEDFETWLSVTSEEMTLAGLKSYADRLSRNGYHASRFLTDYHGRLAFPFVTVVMGLVGIALSMVGTGKRGSGMAKGIGLALLISFLYWTTHSVALALGHGGVLMPVLAGWFTNLIFLSFAFYLILRTRY